MRNQPSRRHSILTAIGVNLLYFAAGMASIWGTSNTYFLSYFHWQGYTIQHSTSSFILITIILPLALVVFFSTKLTARFGFQWTSRACGLIYLLSQVILIFDFSMFTVIICYLVIPMSAISIALLPALNCLWSYFHNSKNIHNAFCIMSYGIGAMSWNIMFTQIVNPNNAKAIINANNIAILPYDVVQNFPICARFIQIVCGFIYFVGVVMIRQNQQERSQDDQDNMEIENVGNQVPRVNEGLNQGNQQKQTQGLPDTERQTIQPESSKTKPQSPQVNALSPQAKPLSPSAKPLQTHKTSYWQILKQPKCFLILLQLIIIDLYPIFLSNNFKVIFMPIVNNDHYLGYCLIANTAANIIGTLLWGWIGDLKGINMSMIFVCLANLLAASIGFFSKDAIMLMVFMIFMGFADRGMETIAGPGLVEIYCLKVASKLMPFKAVSLLLGFVIAPLIQISTTSILTPFNFLRCLYFFPILSFLISLFYYRTYNNSSKPLLVKQPQPMIITPQQIKIKMVKDSI